MRLVIDGRRLTAERTGVGRSLEGLLAEWAATGCPWTETVVVLQDPAGRERVPSAMGVRCEVVGRGWPGLAWELWGLGRVLKRNDLLFAPANLVPWHWRGRTVLVMFDAIQKALPKSFPWHVRWRLGWRYRLAARRADRVLVPSRATAEDARRFYGVERQRLRVIPLAPDPGFRPWPPDSERVREARNALGLGAAPFFLFVGKRSRRRNIPAILAAFDQHRTRHPDHRLVFVGPRARDEVTAWAGSGIRGVIEAGHVAEPVLQGLMADALALLYPSEYEGFGLPVVEAMASGCPVVTLRNSALVEAGGEAAWYLDRSSPEALAEAMHVLASEPDVRAQFAREGLAHVARFSRARMAEAVKAELIEVAKMPGDRA
jgi:glycosyltransferase involved in cell wall biosynthesis